MILLIVFGLGSVVCCWFWSDFSTLVKVIISILYAVFWGLLFIPAPFNVISFTLAQCAFAIVVGGMTFGIDWLMRDAWHVRR
jgi:hypothetical protein